MPSDTRERLLDSAVTLFAEQGYQSTSVEDIARAVGIGPSAIYKHFRSKQDLYAQSLAHLAEPFLALLDDFDPDQGVIAFSRRIFQYHLEHPRLAQLALQASVSGGRHRELLAECWYRPFYQRVRARMLASRSLGGIGEEQLPAYFMAFNNLMLGYINLAGLHAETLGVDPFSSDAIDGEMGLLTLLAESIVERERLRQ